MPTLHKVMNNDQQNAWRDALPVVVKLKNPQSLPVLVQRLKTSWNQRDEVKKALKTWGADAEKEAASPAHPPGHYGTKVLSVPPPPHPPL